MDLTLFIAPPGAGNRKETLFEKIVSLSPDSDYSSVLFLVPNSFVLKSAKSQFYSYLKKSAGRSAYVPFRAMTIKQLAADLYEDCGQHRVISERVRTLILCEILRENNLGYASTLSSLLQKIRHYVPDKSISELKKEVSVLIFEEKAADRAVKALEVLEAYENELKDRKLIDSEGMLKSSIPIIRQSTEHNTKSKELPEKLYNTADRAQSTRLSAKTRIGNTVRKSASLFNYKTLVIDGFFDPTPLELEIMGTLIDHADRTLVSAEEQTEIVRFLQQLKKNLKTEKKPASRQRKSAGYFSYPSVEEEVEGIAKNIKKLILEGTGPWDILVCFPVLSRYLPMLRRVFKKHDIPVSIGESNLSSAKPLILLEDLIACIEDDYPRNDFLSMLTSPYLPEIPEAVREWAVNFSYRAGVIKGKEAWQSIGDILLNESGEIDKDKNGLIAEFHQGINSVIRTIESIRQKKDIAQFLDALDTALNKLGFFDSLDTVQGIAGSEDIADRIKGQLSELRCFAELYGDGKGYAYTPAFYLRYMLQNLKASEDNRDSVRVVPFEAAASLQMPVLFFGGILEGDFPSRPDIDPILPEKVKKQLGMPDLEYYLIRQEKYFRRLLNVSTLEPYFSCPAADGEKIFLPSPFLDWEKTMDPPEPDIYTQEDALVREGIINKPGPASAVFSSTAVFRGKEASLSLYRRIGLMSKGHFSVTGLDLYRRCPLRFYIEKVLGLEISTPPKFEVDARLWGNLAHRTMEHLFTDGAPKPDELEDKLFNSLQKAFKQIPLGSFWERVAKEVFLKLVPEIKEQENALRSQGFSTLMVEKKIKAELQGIKLKGKVDRVDVRIKAPDAGRQTTNDERFVILLDYKTGSIDRNSLQLPLYAGMWQEIFSEQVEKTGYYSLKKGKIQWYPKKTTMEAYIQNALQSSDELVQKMKKGIFTPEPSDAGECRYCYHSPICNGSK
jgi:ATP-dependent helicase/DNAse subunit B